MNSSSSYRPIEGRRPAGYVRAHIERAGTTVGHYFAESAHHEAASAIAFERLALELDAHAAPRELRARVRRACEDERTHAHTVGLLARRFDAEVPVLELAGAAPRSLFTVALENVIEGVVRETFAAAIALRKAAYAADAATRIAFHGIALDECRHGDLALEIDRWARHQLTMPENEELDLARLRAVEQLRIESAREPAEVLVAVVGLPSSEGALDIIERLEHAARRRASLLAA